MYEADWLPVEVTGIGGKAPLVIVCEHASNDIPSSLAHLGLSHAALLSHVAWDIGAYDVAKCLSAVLDAPLVAGSISRLVYDCNRPLEANDCILCQTDIHQIPGNFDLSAEDRKTRYDRVHTPFHAQLSEVIEAQIERSSQPVSLVTIHSFTAVYHKKIRDLDIGFICSETEDLASTAFDVETGRNVYRVAFNEPYSAADGVTHTLKKHAEPRHLNSVMIEIRNDLIHTPDTAEKMALHISDTLCDAMSRMNASIEESE